MNIDQLIEENRVRFSHYHQGHLYYRISYLGQPYLFAVPATEVGEIAVRRDESARRFAHYIRMAVNSGSLIKAR